MALQFTRATKAQRKARIALMGPTGSGKTLSALLIAQGLCPEPRDEEAGTGGIAVIDTEHDSASLYCNDVAFDGLTLESYAPERYVEAVKAAVAAKYSVLVIDSWSHAWAGKDGLLEFVDQKKKQARGNDFTVWGDATPKQNAMVETILAAPLHVIITMRVKMAYVLEDQERNGRRVQVPKKVGLQPVQRDGVEYEFDVICDLDLDHTLMVSKTRCRSLDGRVVSKPGADLGAEIGTWLADGVAAPPPRPPATEPPPPAKTTTTVTINGRKYETAGVTAQTLVDVWTKAAVLDKLLGKGSAKALLPVATSTDLTEAAAQDYLQSLAAAITLAEEAKAANGGDPAPADGGVV